MKITKSQLKRIIKEELESALQETEMIAYDDYDEWDSDPNLARIEQILSSELDLKDFKFNLLTDFPGQYTIATRGDLVGLQKKAGIDAPAVAGILRANGYKTDYGYDGLTAFDPKYKEV